MSDTKRPGRSTPRPLPEALWRRMLEFRQRVMVGMQSGLSALAALDLTLPQSMVLFSLVERGPLSISQLQPVAGRSQAATSHLVEQLERRGLVARKADPADGRRTQVHATPQALETVRQVESLRRRGLEEVLGRIPASVVRQLDEALEAVLSA
ncbi:MarR family winged helix-turn-helix transcriptional regulator, partial [Hyalangium sp.]|uniref:MarR family winged helix-turn-helix transcriptional regulator n=1 Tax=Hyalangium sp. TaxID=2028555 RepID=UPI002D4D7E82